MVEGTMSDVAADLGFLWLIWNNVSVRIIRPLDCIYEFNIIYYLDTFNKHFYIRTFFKKKVSYVD